MTKDARLWLGLRAEGVPTCECAREQQQRRACRGSAAGGAQMQIRRAVEKPKFGQVSGLVGFHPRCTLLRVGGDITGPAKASFGGLRGTVKCVGNILKVVAGTGRASMSVW